MQRKHLRKITSFHDENFKQVIEETLYNTVKEICEKPIASNILEGQSWRHSPTVWNQTCMPTVTTAVRWSPGSFSQNDWGTESEEGDTNWTVRKLHYLFADDMNLYLCNRKTAH